MPSRNPLADGLLEVAEVLLKQRGRPIFVQAALRRSISTAYYAVFHTLCQVCGDGLRLWTLGGDELEPVYRSLDHRRTKDRLHSAAVRDLHPDLTRIAIAFVELQRLRHEADYSQPGRLQGAAQLIKKTEAATLVDSAHLAVRLVDGLPPDVRRQLAVLLLFDPKHRARETRR
jgi:hypothetical protein